MLLNLDQIGVPMKRVFQLSEELKINHKRIELTQALTLNQSKPQMGLKGGLGLFGSQEWWANINKGKMPQLRLSGVIGRVYVAGQEETGMNNTIDLIADDGTVHAAGIYVNNTEHIMLFRVGCRVDVVYALDELKQQPAMDGGINYSKIALEMAVSLHPVA